MTIKTTMLPLSVYEYGGHSVVLRMAQLSDTQFNCAFTIYFRRNVAFLRTPEVAHREPNDTTELFASTLAAQANAVKRANAWIDAHPNV
jgi:hypothetical protein